MLNNIAVHCICHSWDDEYLKQKAKKEPLLIRMKVAMYNLYCRLVGKAYHKEPKTFKERLGV